MYTEIKSASKINAYIFIIFMSSMFLYSLPMLFKYLTRHVENVSELVNGDVMRSFEKYYDKNIFLHKPSLNMWSLVQYDLFNEGSPGVIVGEEGWLFTKEEFLRSRQYDRQLELTVNKIKDYADQIESSGKSLIIVPVPMKVDIYREFVSFKVNQRTKNLHEDFIDLLSRNYLKAVDVKPTFISKKDEFPIYFKTDTHWTPEGANLAAMVIANYFSDRTSSKAFITNKVGEKTFEGDLLNYFGLGELKPLTDLQADIANVYETYGEVSDTDNIDLFGDSEISLAVVGTSYTKLETWNFPGFVKQALGEDLLVVANEAKGPLASMSEFIDSEIYMDPAIDTVIWEFPVRTILQQ